MKHESSLSEHLTFLNELTAQYKSGTLFGIIAKAFDFVPHNKLIIVLKKIQNSQLYLKVD